MEKGAALGRYAPVKSNKMFLATLFEEGRKEERGMCINFSNGVIGSALLVSVVVVGREVAHRGREVH